MTRILDLSIGDDVRICLFDSFNLVNLCDHHIGEGSFVCDIDEKDNVGPSETRVSLFDPGKTFEGLQHILCSPRFDFDKNISLCCHYALPVVIAYRPASPASAAQRPGGCPAPAVLG